ncbi:MAG: winged helix-turn-helix transcriptional regulator [Actinobacteria bacterium]|nr:winged helix-turn-helix transcriptional regulator [Actinomycetota bacterium]
MSSTDRTPPPLTVGSALRRAWTELIDEVLEKLVAAGYHDLRRVHQPILRDVLVTRQRPTEIGAKLGLSKQAINDVLREFEANGYITLEPDPDDGRAKRVVATERGWQLSNRAMALSDAVGRRWAKHVGEERYAVFEEVLQEIVTAQDTHDASA